MSFFDKPKKPPADEMDKPMQARSLPPLEDLPNREWLRAIISDVSYEYAMFDGKVQNVQDADKNDILDDDGNPIPRKIYKITYDLLDFTLPNGKPRNGWLNLGVAFGKNAKMPGYLLEFGYVLNMDALPSPKEVIALLTGKHVFIQFALVKTEDGETKQRLVKDAIKLADKPHTIKEQVKEEAKPADPRAGGPMPTGNVLTKEEEEAWDKDL